MVNIEITDETLILQVEGFDKVWALKSSLEIPLKHITGVRIDTEVVKHWWHGFKLPGSNIPGVLTAGTFYQDGKRVFWDIHHPEKALIISLQDETYSELVIEVAHSEQALAEIQSALRK